MPDLMLQIFDLFAALIRLAGLVLFGFAFARFALDAYKKGLQSWQYQGAVFLGFVALSVAFSHYIPAGGFGGFALGAGGGLMVGLREKKEEESK